MTAGSGRWDGSGGERYAVSVITVQNYYMALPVSMLFSAVRFTAVHIIGVSDASLHGGFAARKRN